MEVLAKANKSVETVEEYPADKAYSIIFGFEENFNQSFQTRWMKQNWHWCFYFIGIYFILIYAGRSYMQNKPRLTLRVPLIVWNLCLAAFSIFGTIRMWPEMIFSLREYGVTYTVCDNGFLKASKVTSFWAWMFVISKIPELGDTLFIVLRKQKLIFLHWYHHTSIVLACWYCYKELQAACRWYICLNYFVHSCMYTYFAARAAGLAVPKFVSMFITIIQILQLVTATFTTLLGHVAQANGYPCCNSVKATLVGGFVTVSYLILFVLFFWTSYFSKSDRHLRMKQK